MIQRYPSAWRGRADPPAVPAMTRACIACRSAPPRRPTACASRSGHPLQTRLPWRSTAAASRWSAPHRGSIYCFDPDAAPGARYAFRFDTTDIAIPDPASRFNPDGVHAPSEVVDAERVRMARRRLARAPLGRSRHLRAARRHVHARRAPIAAAAERLDYLAALGVTAIELMPLAATPGRWNWGYDGVLPFAPHAGVRPPRRSEALRRCGARTRPHRCCSTSSTTTSGPTAIISATMHRSSSRRATRHRGATP